MSLMDNLLNLFRVDAQVRGLRSRLRSAERFMNGQQAKLDALKADRNELRTRKKQHQAKTANLETEIATINERIEKLRNEMSTASTQKQYSALLAETNTMKTVKSDLENTVLEEMEQVEVLVQEIVSFDRQIDDRAKQRSVAETELDERRTEVGERLEELETERAIAAATVPDTDLAVFDELAITCDDVMTTAEMIDKRNREYACGACNMQIPFEKIAQLMGTADELIRCNSCHRILYLQEETRGAISAKK